MKTSNKYSASLQLFTLIAVSVFLSCKKMINIDAPINESVASKVFSSDASAMSALNGLYVSCLNKFDNSDMLSPLLSSDELIAGDASYFDFNTNTLKGDNSLILRLWNSFYNLIYQSNSIIEGVQASDVLSSTVKNQLLGEAKFMRAFLNFELVNFYGDVPLITSTDVRDNSIASRKQVDLVYQQIITDLKGAQTLLSDTYVSADRARVNKSTATALLARVYLYRKDYSNAEIQSTGLINNSAFYQLEPLNKTFLKSSKETIFQIANSNSYTGIASSIIPGPSATKMSYYFTSNFRNSLESGDRRKDIWMNNIVIGGISYLYPYKYKKVTSSTNLEPEYLVVFRLGEQYLIRAEARAHQANKLNEAKEDINVLRRRAGLEDYQQGSAAELLSVIEKERRVELSMEFGHRWFDLKRTGRVNSVMGVLKPTWKPTAELYPIPADELRNDPNLNQNPGY